MDLRDVARYAKSHPASVTHDQIVRLATGYCELREAVQPTIDERNELRAIGVKLVQALHGPLHELGPILERLHEVVGPYVTP